MVRRSARKAAQVVLVARPSAPDAAGARQWETELLLFNLISV